MVCADNTVPAHVGLCIVFTENNAWSLHDSGVGVVKPMLCIAVGSIFSVGLI